MSPPPPPPPPPPDFGGKVHLKQHYKLVSPYTVPYLPTTRPCTLPGWIVHLEIVRAACPMAVGMYPTSQPGQVSRAVGVGR